MNSIKNTQILSDLSKEDYFKELEMSDVGLIFLNENFSIPNFPSKLLDYLYFDLAIFSNTDKITDICDFINTTKIGKCFYGISDIENMIIEIVKLQKNSSELNRFKNNSFKSLCEYFNVDNSFKLLNEKI